MGADKEKYSELENLYIDIREWLKFTETKNAALLTFNAATLFGYLKLYEKIDILSKGKILFSISIIGIFISLLIVLFSFWPKKVEDLTFYSGNDFTSVNLLFYDNIKKIGINKLKRAFAVKYYNKDVNNLYYQDLVTQIYSLSVLTVRKSLFFKLGLIINCLSYIIFLVHLLAN